jgi:hypothetical protein
MPEGMSLMLLPEANDAIETTIVVRLLKPGVCKGEMSNSSAFTL